MRKRLFAGGKQLRLLLPILLFFLRLTAQPTFPVNGVSSPTTGSYAFTNATIVKDTQVTLRNATLLIKEGKIVAVGNNITLPKDAVVTDCKGKYIYPSFIDIYSDYGIAAPQRERTGFNFGGTSQIVSNQKGAFGWNQAIRSDVDAAKIFMADEGKAKPLREAGFGTVLSHQKDGIARGTGVLATLAAEKENRIIIKEKASAHYSLNRGSSTQSYPNSVMGAIALLRQTYLDAQWYTSNPAAEGVNLSLKAFNETKNLPQVFEGGDKWTDIRADRIGDEFGVQYIIKAGGNEYQRISEIAATHASYILPLNFPQAMDVEDPNDARYVSLTDMKHWELAPTNPAAFEKANINFCLTASDLRDPRQFMTNLRKAISYGLSENRALDALTKTPASLLGVYDKVGSLETGKLANFLVVSGPIFQEKTIVFQNWVQGEKYAINETAWNNITGTWQLAVMGASGNAVNYTLQVKSSTSATVTATDTMTSRFSFDGKLVNLSFPAAPVRKMVGADLLHNMAPGRIGGVTRLSGVNNNGVWQGNGEDSAGGSVSWTANLIKKDAEKADSSNKKKMPLTLGKITYPLDGYGWENLPKQEDILIKNATVWTSEKEAVLEGTDLLIKNGKIAQVGRNLTDEGARIIDGTGKYVTAGIIDEHSHIAVSSINEGGQSVTAEVRIGDNLNPDDINIYRQLSGGVTSSHILHGSANSIGGQTQLIKLRWGVNDEELKFKNAAPFIKFALGENVKRTTATQGNNRFPDTRMGVEEVLVDAFQRASDYQKAIKAAEENNKKKGATPVFVRRDLELDALSEVMNKKRFITCHSYIQSEITAAMRVAERFGFRYNTFTHVLEGYKVADKLKAHGANASTFSDWWAYKVEVQDAIPQNAAIMQRMGLNVAINSDDPEMARRLNQEAAKSVKYGGISEQDAWKMVTINPATMLHVQDRVGSIKPGKDADVVVWSNNPLSIYAKPEKTIVDGIIYFDIDRDLQLRRYISTERNRLVQKMLAEKRSGATMGAAVPSFQVLLGCGDHGERQNGLITVETNDNDEANANQ
ncbi:MAG: amidohydrolase family protein [Bacteroidota bacterium]